MIDKNLISKIFAEIKKDPDETGAYRDLLMVLRNILKDEESDKDDIGLTVALARNLLTSVQTQLSVTSSPAAFHDVYRKTLLLLAPYDFDSYMIYLELDRKPQERFYLPRRRQLRTIVEALQDFADDELDELFLSMPPRVGKTSILMFFVTWLIGRDPERSNLYSAYSGTITGAFYNGVLEILTDQYTYLWTDVFPERKIVQTNAQENTLNLDRKKRYPSLTARSLYGTLNGACDCNGVLISDDLIGGIEEALNKDRLMSAWSKVDNNLIPRAKENAKILWCGTRWSVIDPAGLRMHLLQTDPRFEKRRYRIINTPALDDNDESNFDYLYRVGFSTDYYRQRRASFEANNDAASWLAQYMGQPIERDGAVFSADSLRYYNGVLPDRAPDRAYMVCDPAFGGGDYTAAPVVLKYDTDLYIPDVVFNPGEKDETMERLFEVLKATGVHILHIEANKMLKSYVDELTRYLKGKGLNVSVISKPANNRVSKEARIYDRAPEIRSHMVFLDPAHRSPEYQQFMNNVYAFTVTGRNKHDDAPDSLAMAVDVCFPRSGVYEVFRRPI